MEMMGLGVTDFGDWAEWLGVMELRVTELRDQVEGLGVMGLVMMWLGQQS